MTIQKCANDATIEHSFKGLMPFLWLKFRNDMIPIDETLDLESVFIRWAATKANQLWRELILQA